MASEATIRLAQPDDAAALARLAERTFRDTFSNENTAADMEAHCLKSFGVGIQRREILDSNCVTILADMDGELIAFAQVRIKSLNACVSGNDPCELYRLYVSSEWQGRGLAHNIMREVLATATRYGADCIWLGVWEQNPRAIAFYNKYGFEVVGDHVFQLGDDMQRDLVMISNCRSRN